jgi:Hemerythrin HHE cation binding domain
MNPSSDPKRHWGGPSAPENAESDASPTSFIRRTQVAAPTSLRDVMTRDHEHLVGVFTEVALAWKVGNHPETRRAWCVLVLGLERHLDLEERVLFPAFKCVRPAEMRDLAAQHKQIRRRALEVGNALEKQLLRTEALRAFIGALRTHAVAEEALMYAWADMQHCPRARMPAKDIEAPAHAPGCVAHLPQP